MSYLVALFKCLLLMLLVGIPYVVYRWAKTNRPTRTGVLTGATLDFVVSPVSLGLYLLGFLVPLIGMLPGLVGLVLTMFHGAPVYQLSILFGFLERGVASTARKAIILGNIVGFSVGPALDVWGLLSGARQLAVVFAVIHLLIASAFIWAWRASMSAKTS